MPEIINQNKKHKKSFIEVLLEVLLVLSFLIIAAYTAKDDDIQKFYRWLVVPGGLFVLRIIFGLTDIGVAFAAIITYINNEGLNGVPVISLFLVMIVAVIYGITSEKFWTDILKFTFGILSGSYTQAKINSKKNKN